MIAVDTNILARFYCEDPDDPDAGRQRPRAVRNDKIIGRLRAIDRRPGI
jgi:hypothetical protein